MDMVSGRVLPPRPLSPPLFSIPQPSSSTVNQANSSPLSMVSSIFP